MAKTLSTTSNRKYNGFTEQEVLGFIEHMVGRDKKPEADLVSMEQAKAICLFARHYHGSYNELVAKTPGAGHPTD